MSQSGIGEPSSQKLHPFFAKGTSCDPSSAVPTSNFVNDSRFDEHNTPNSTLEAGHDAPPAKRHKSEHQESHYDPGIGSLKNSTATGTSEASPACPLPAVSDQPLPTSQQVNANSVPNQQGLQSGPHNVANAVGPDTAQAASLPSCIQHSEQHEQREGKKVLKLNSKTGTLGSPPKPKQKPKKNSRIVCIKYGHNEKSRSEIGLKIAQILDGSLQLPRTPTKPRSNKRSTRNSDNPAKPSSSMKVTHPFFSGKPKARSSTPAQPTESVTKSPSKRNSVFMSTPVSPRKPRNPFSPANTTRMPQFGIKSGGTKVPGAKYPMWPTKGMSHIRGNDVYPITAEENGVETGGSKKSKGQVTLISPGESVLVVVADRIDIERVRCNLPQDADSFNPAPAELRIPQKRCESGPKLQHRIRSQLTTTSHLALAGVEDLSVDELAGPAPKLAHPAISRHYLSLGTQLSAYDRSTCESLSWTHKYAPASAAQVLQKHNEAHHIKQWLEAMKVQSVETGSSDSTGDKGRHKADALPKKKRKKNKVDDFIVDTDEEGSELEEITGSDGEGIAPTEGLKSVVRFGGLRSKEPGRLKNSIIISGPHGCGKTAAVYAIAKELDFEVFEINSGTRRSGKDILERVGDMTRNHLVQQHRAQQPPTDREADDESKESKSGKQGMMTAFFKTKAAPEKKEKPKPSSAAPAPKPSPKGQKQSLILIEEADVLYEEDKQFWATLMGMMNQSRRPFVITCNDESLIPLQSLNLHGIFRFSPAPMPVAVDLCLVIAANEGHSLRRSAVESLYRARYHDLRATISDLNFWCQIGVGDRRGGFDWFYKRWPKGCDIDKRGDIVRVISEDTYQNGMGWIGRDVIVSECDRYDREVEALRQCWNFWRADVGDWCQSSELCKVTKATLEAPEAYGKKAAALEALDQFYQAMSDADICSGGVCATWMREPVDASLPDLPTKTRDDFIIGRSLLEADGYTQTANPSKTISMALKSQARAQLRSQLQDIRQSPDSLGLGPIDESWTVSRLEASFHKSPSTVTRMDIAYAFDPIAVAPKSQPSSHLDPSVFDRTMRLIVLDVAPWIRGIVAFEHQLMQERLKLSSILSEGGTRKRMRNTRSAYSALEGGERGSTRREQYFGDCLTTQLVMRTGGDSWQNSLASVRSSIHGTETPTNERATPMEETDL
ncbi:ATPase, AAA-type, core [Pochonia chlamydosporia 170]|uniref:ATPase, AAA-type, core n=1 Tax=Pochonia chlamydosporia 170 TaxID=1380566 RepID=A0A179G7K7_METCM|nr:ATPase, AAA-type, core [Pochonia chlamydosporia 170]OAQ73490.1 ATPase, AAA-type, core [Pochonia chlamydosporia 170]